MDKYMMAEINTQSVGFGPLHLNLNPQSLATRSHNLSSVVVSAASCMVLYVAHLRGPQVLTVTS